MKSNLKLFSLLSFSFLIGVTGNAISQDYHDWVWKLPMTMVVSAGEYSNLPVTDQTKYQNPNTTTRIIHTPAGDISVAPNIRPFPHSETQSSVEVKSMGGNGNIIFASWNSIGSVNYGTGFCYTNNEGITWTGNFQMFSPNGGDPAPWIWPMGSPYAGRLGTAVGGTTISAGYSTT